MVLPIGPLMIEHRLIERMIVLLKRDAERVEKGGTVDPRFVETAVDFVRTYADRCHHGKEEEILFRDLKKKMLTDDDRRVMGELIQEHAWGRETTRKLVAAKERYAKGDKTAIPEIVQLMKSLGDFYPRHIAKEDKVFFKPAMKYLTDSEKEQMLQEEYEFDKRFIHVVYTDIVLRAEKGL